MRLLFALLIGCQVPQGEYDMAPTYSGPVGSIAVTTRHGGVVTPERTEEEDEVSTVRVLCVGDSNTRGHLDVDSSYRKYLFNTLLSRRDHYVTVGGLVSGYQDGCISSGIRHQGIGGASTADVLAAIGGYLTSYTPDLVILMVGTADAVDLNDMTPSSFPAILDTIRATGARVVVHGVVPYPPNTSINLGTINAFERAACSARMIPFVETPSLTVGSPDIDVTGHLNASGGVKVAASIAAAIQ